MVHCYIDTDTELKDTNNAEYLELILDSILEDINHLNLRLKRDPQMSPELDNLENYVCHILMEVITKFFEKPYNQHPLIDVRQHQKRLISLIQQLTELQNGTLANVDR